MNGTSFKVAPTEVALCPIHEIARDDAFVSMCRGGRVEQHYESSARLVNNNSMNPLLEATSAAFFEHYPLILTPDVIWFCIAQGLANHVNKHPEELRGAFVAHEGKKTLVVSREDFELGKKNPWPEVFSAFSAQIAEHVGKAHALLVADFSTTGPTERAASEIVVMDTFQRYFKYKGLFGCGIPSLTLSGTPDDWRSIRRRAAVLAEYGLQEWTEALLPVLDKLVETAEGRPDIEFWQSFYRFRGGSGISQVTGWIGVLFPYLKSGRGAGSGELSWNPYMATWWSDWKQAKSVKGQGALSCSDPNLGPSEGHFPSGLCSAPVEFTHMLTCKKANLRFVGGMFGVVQDDETLALQPEFGWAIVEYPDGDTGGKDDESMVAGVRRFDGTDKR